MNEVIVTIGEDGAVQVEAKNVKGSGCAALTKAIEAALGQTTGDVKKPEFHQHVSQQTGQSAKAGQ